MSSQKDEEREHVFVKTTEEIKSTIKSYQETEEFKSWLSNFDTLQDEDKNVNII